MSAEITSLAQVSGVGLLRVPKSPAADFQDSPSNVLPFPSELDSKEYRQFTLPTGETIPLSGFKALYLQSLLSTSRENPLLDSDARSILRKPGEDITPKKLQKRALQTKWQLEEMFYAYGIPYTVTECFHEVSPGELQRAKYLRHLETVEPDAMEELANTSSFPANEDEQSPPFTTSETSISPSEEIPAFSIQDQLRGLIEEGKYTFSQIAGLIYPGIPLGAARNRLSPQLQRLRGTLLNEGLCVPDGRHNSGGVVSMKSLAEAAADAARPLPEEHEVAPEQTPEKTLPKPQEDTPAAEQTTDQPQQTAEEEALAPEDLPSEEIKDPIERRVESRSSGRPKLVLEHTPESPGKVTARIQIPGRGRTRGLELNTDEAILFHTLFTSPASYTHGRLELAMVDIARSDAFDKFGGFERVFNSLNRKLGAWRMAIGLDEDNRFVFVSASSKLLTLTPIYRNLDKDFENSGLGERQRRRQPSHGKQKL